MYLYYVLCPSLPAIYVYVTLRGTVRIHSEAIGIVFKTVPIFGTGHVELIRANRGTRDNIVSKSTYYIISGQTVCRSIATNR